MLHIRFWTFSLIFEVSVGDRRGEMEWLFFFSLRTGTFLFLFFPQLIDVHVEEYIAHKCNMHNRSVLTDQSIN